MSASDLFKPLKFLHGSPMKNRFMMAPLTSQQSDFDGKASEYDQFGWNTSTKRLRINPNQCIYWEAGAIAFKRQLGIHSDKHLPGLTKMATVIREGGALSAVQLQSCGSSSCPVFRRNSCSCIW
ncbi:hypothetical protein [Chryseobacterium indoltheticum]|uniref:oxidoreductase n=1 Tax=Chryseobacterium indoltheticum TaxID=254 RepID=UPI003F494BA1